MLKGISCLEIDIIYSTEREPLMHICSKANVYWMNVNQNDLWYRVLQVMTSTLDDMNVIHLSKTS